MSDLSVRIHKDIREERQGEIFSPVLKDHKTHSRKFYIESYGCQMNFSDSEIVASILAENGFGPTLNYVDADLILINTCSIREKAEQTVRSRLHLFRQAKKAKPGTLIGVLGCMAERLKEKFLEEEKLVDMVVGPDSYRSLPALIEEADNGQRAINVLLSREETYADISPVRLNSNGITAFVSITRGCNNMCSFCVVPFTRGRERSRNPDSILKECTTLFNEGFREVTLLGQNVDSYNWKNDPVLGAGGMDPFIEKTGILTFAGLLEKVASIDPLLRVRFSTSHPKDITDEVLFTMRKFENICKSIHLPVQSGSSRILELMNRTYSRNWYIAKLDRIREILPDCGISSDMIAGFCTETNEDHMETLSLMEYAGFDFSYMFYYSERPGTLAARRYVDDIPESIKKKRLEQIVKVQNKLSLASNIRDLHSVSKVLIEGDSRKSCLDWSGRNSQNKVVVFPKDEKRYKKGDYVHVRIEDCTGGTLIGRIQ